MAASRHPGASRGAGGGPKGGSNAAAGRGRKPRDGGDFDEQTTIDPHATERARASTSSPDGQAKPRSSTSTTQTQVAEDSGEVLLEPSHISEVNVRSPVLNKKIATGTGEVGGTIDELTMAEEAHPPPQLALVKSPPPPPPPASKRSDAGDDGSPGLAAAWLVVHAGADRGRRFPLGPGKSTIGRGMDNTIVLSDIAVSRRHLLVDQQDDHFVMTDLGSGNGTLVNDQDEDGAYRLNHGDRLELGNTILLFECPEMAARAPRTAGKDRWTKRDDEMSTVAGRKMPTAEELGQQPPRPRRATSIPPLPPPRSEGRGRVSRPPPIAARSEAPERLDDEPHALIASSSNIGQSSLIHPQHLVAPGQGHMAPGPPPPASDRSADLFGFDSGVPVPAPPGLPSQNAYSPYPSPAPYPGYASSSHNQPFQYPDGVMSPTPSSGGRRMLFGILIIAFIAVGAGIIMAVASGDGKDKPVAAAGSADDSAKGSTDQAAAGEAEQVAASATDTSSGTGASATETSPAADATEPAAASSASDAGSADSGKAVASQAPSKQVEADPEVTLTSLYGTTKLDPNMFGNDETFIEELPEPTSPETGTSDESEDGDEGDDASDEASPPSKPARKNDDEPRRTVKRDPPKSTRENNFDASAARRRAETLYLEKDFSEAASVLRAAADKVGSKKEADALRTTAKHYQQVGNLLSVSDRDGPKALDAYKRAHQLDERYGDGGHDYYIGAKIGTVAPRAAGSYVARGDLSNAKRAVQEAERFGGGPDARPVRAKLESEAEKLYDQARAAKSNGDNKKAGQLAREAMSIAPTNSAVYGKARALTR